MNNMTCALIIGYKKYISPYKGFCCAHKKLHGGMSCSDVALEYFKHYSFFKAFTMLRLRFKSCKSAYICLSKQDKNNEKKEGSDLKEKIDAASNVSFCCLPF